MPAHDPQRARIFVSYARSDGEDFARDLRRKLIAEFGDQQIWRDRDRMEGGVGWWKQITTALDNVEYMVLVATPAAMTSDIVKKEWRYARQQGVCVYPVQVPDLPIDFDALPRWMSDGHFYDLGKEWTTFIGHLHSKCDAMRVPFYGVPDLPDHFVPRPDVFEPMKAQLLDDSRDNPVAITTSLVGAGGFGKTTLAAALCHDEDVQTAFDDGIMWVTLGENPNVLLIINGLYRALTGEQALAETVHEAAANFSEKLADNDILLVIDDIWDSAHLKPFLQGGRRCARLMTTRFSNIALDANARQNDVDEMSTAQSVEMLLAGIEPEPDDLAPFEALADRLGEWALMLEIVNRMLLEALELGDDIAGALDFVNEVLDEEGIYGIEKDSGDERFKSAEGVLSASFRQLKDDETRSLFELAVFLDDTDIPLTSIMALWDMGFARTRKQILRYARSSFVKYDAEKQIIRIHDVVREVLEIKLKERMSLTDTHRRLIDNYGDLTALPDDYAWRNIAYHLKAADQLDTLRDLLMTFDYLQAKLNATDPNALIADCIWIAGDSNISLLRSAISMSVNTLEEKSVLASILYNRLQIHSDRLRDISELISEARLSSRYPNLFTETQSLQPAGGALLQTIPIGSEVNTLALSFDRQYLIIGASDGMVRFWNLKTARLSKELQCARGSISYIEVYQEFLITYSEDEMHVNIWNKLGKELIKKLTLDNIPSMRKQPITVTDSGLVYGTRDGALHIWNWKSDQHTELYQYDQSILGLISVENEIIIAYRDTLQVFDLSQNRVVRSLEGNGGTVNSLSTEGDLLVSGSSNGKLTVWNWKTGEMLKQIHPKQSRQIWSVVIRGNYILCGSQNCNIEKWNWRRSELVTILKGHSDWIWSTAVNSSILFSGSRDQTVKIWDWQLNDLSTSSHLFYQKHNLSPATEKSVTSIIAEKDEVIVGSYDKKIDIWKTNPPELTRSIKAHSYPINSITYSHNMLFSVSQGKMIKIWNMETGVLEHSFLGHQYMNSIQVNGNILFVALGNGTVCLWDWQKGLLLKTINLSNLKSIHGLTIVDENIILAGGWNGSIQIWNSEKDNLIRELKFHTDGVMSLLVSDIYLISGSRDGFIAVWDWKQGVFLHALKGHTGYVNSIAICKNTKLGSVSNDKSLHIWDWHKNKYLYKFVSDARLTCCAYLDSQDMFILGDSLGNVHFLRPNAALLRVLRGE